MHPKRHKQDGFTLIELLVVSVLLAILGSILYGTITGIMRGRSLVRGQLETVRVGQYIVEKIGRELSSAIASTIYDPNSSFSNTQPTPNQVSNNLGGAQNFGGFATNTRSGVFLAVNEKGDSRDKDAITFICSNSSQLLKGQNSNFGIVQLNYRLEKDFDTLTKDHDQERDEKLFSLVRREFPAGANITDKIREFRTYEYALANNVAGLNFRYMKQGRWQNTWTPRDPGLPQAIEISLSLQDSEGHIESFRTSFAVGGT